MSEITPSVGRQVWYYENDTQPEPWAATVIKVNAPNYQATPFTPITVLAISPEGEQFIIPDLPCSPIAAPYPHYRWMPYQKAQAAKAESGTLGGQVNPCMAKDVLKTAQQVYNKF